MDSTYAAGVLAAEGLTQAAHSVHVLNNLVKCLQLCAERHYAVEFGEFREGGTLVSGQGVEGGRGQGNGFSFFEGGIHTLCVYCSSSLRIASSFGRLVCVTPVACFTAWLHLRLLLP